MEKFLEKFLITNSKPLSGHQLKKRVLFRRNFMGYGGGHQKVYDYYQHLASRDDMDVNIVFSAKSILNHSNPWIDENKRIIQKFNPEQYDIIFLAGRDWEVLEDEMEDKKIVINLIQGYKHANKDHDLYQFLKRKAIRIAVSHEVANAIKETGQVNGPVYTIENGHRMYDINMKKNNDIYILGLKNNLLALELQNELSKLGFSVICSLKKVLRDEVFMQMASSRISILLPKETEGFYLPALESMKYSDMTIVPDCIGNRSFCYDQKNCLVPEYTKEDIINKTIEAMNVVKNDDMLDNYKKEASATVAKHSINAEREAFYNVLKAENLL